MEYAIQELARLAGVTTRTLRWYDQIGLLKPSRTADSGYRYYGRAEDHNEGVYGAEVRAKYGDAAMDQANQAVLSLTLAQYQEWNDLGRAIQQRLEEAVQGGLSPAGEVGRTIVDLHRRWLTLSGTPYDPAKHRGIAALYVADPRFTAYYDRRVPGCARFLQDAVTHWVQAP